MWACNNGLFELALMVTSGDQTRLDETNTNVTRVQAAAHGILTELQALHSSLCGLI